jgi:hypothetical protein
MFSRVRSLYECSRRFRLDPEEPVEPPQSEPPTPRWDAFRRAPEDPPTTRLKAIGPDAAPPPGGPYGVQPYGTQPHGVQPPPAAPAVTPRTRARSRKRTPLILAGAALLGVVGGLCFGYLKQADEPPAPLPPLSQGGLAYPGKHLAAGADEPVAAKDDRRVKTDADLRKLLLDAPSGADKDTLKLTQDGWMTVGELADQAGKPSYMLRELLQNGLRRTATVTWRQQNLGPIVLIQLWQFRDDAEMGSAEFMQNEQLSMSYGLGAGTGTKLQGSGNGRVYSDGKPVSESGVTLYQASVIARRGDIVMEVSLVNDSRIGEGTITALGKRQLERL